MFGTIVNTIAILVGGLLGLLFKKGIPKKASDTLFKGLGLCTIFIAITGCVEGGETLVVILSIILGAIIGELFDLDKRINQLGSNLEKRVAKGNNSNSNIAEGFVTASLLFCVGALAIVGSLQSGLSSNHTTLYVKSTMDFVASIIFASTLGLGVLFSAGAVLIYQGTITMLAFLVSPYLSEPVVANMACVGYVILIGLGLNMLGVTKLKVMNYVPAIFLPIIIYPLSQLIMSLVS